MAGAEKRRQRSAPQEKGRWAVSYLVFGDIPISTKARKHYKSGLGLGLRAGYGFWDGLSVETEFQYDLLFKEGGTNKIQDNKNLFSLAPGLRYTWDLIPDLSTYVQALFGLTVDYTKNVASSWNMSYALGTGFDVNVTENLSLGPAFRYRHVFEHEKDDMDMDVKLISIGAALTYLFD